MCESNSDDNLDDVLKWLSDDEAFESELESFIFDVSTGSGESDIDQWSDLLSKDLSKFED